MPDLESSQRAVAEALLTIHAVEFRPQNPVTFASGIKSPVYVDNRRLPFHPAQWHVVIEAFYSFIQTKHLTFDVIAGVATGGIPHSAALAYTLQTPSVFIRKESKSHGKSNLVEGGDVAGKHVLLVEDMVTTGRSLLQGVEALRQQNAIVTHCLAITTYDFPEAQTALSTAGMTLHPLTTFAIILNTALQLRKLQESEQAVIEDWFYDHHGWAARHGF